MEYLTERNRVYAVEHGEEVGEDYGWPAVKL